MPGTASMPLPRPKSTGQIDPFPGLKVNEPVFALVDYNPRVSWDEGLRNQQREATGGPTSHTVLLAGPGTGKTYVLVRRVQYLIDVEHIAPRSIIALTFTRAAAAEMRSRLEQRLGETGRRVRVSTLHSFALSELVRREIAAIERPIRVVGDWEERHVVLEELKRLLKRRVTDVRDALHRLADDWNSLAIDGDGWEQGYPDAQFISAWQQHRAVYGYTLRDELVYQLLVGIRTEPDWRPGKSCDVLLVDEYQDLNMCDLTTIALIAERHGADVFATGDDDQSIYSFRHAHPAGIRGFTDDYESAQRKTLEECLRCGPAIVDISNWLIGQERDREPKTLTSVTAWEGSVHLLRFANQAREAEQLAELIDREIELGTPAHEILILLRSDKKQKVSKLLERQLNGLGRNCYLPRRELEVETSAQIILEFLVLASGMAADDYVDDLAVRTLLELRDNRISVNRIWKAIELAIEERIRFLEAIDVLRANPKRIAGTGGPGLVAAVDDIVACARQLVPTESEPFTDWVDRVMGVLGITNAEREAFAPILEPLLAEFAEPEDGVLERDFIQALAAAMTNVEDAKPTHLQDQVTITTMHGAKGLSAEMVIVLQVEDEVIPGFGGNADDLNEARRLLYVSLTRAKERLLVTACSERTGDQAYVGSELRPQRSLTRFLAHYQLKAENVEEYFANSAR